MWACCGPATELQGIPLTLPPLPFFAQKDLSTLNINQNCIKKLEGLGALPKLDTLHVAHNNLSSLDDLEHLKELPALSSLDLQHNKIESPEVVDLLASLPGLKVLYLQGNPCVKEIKHYRKTMIARCAGLRYLDDRPVFPDERLRAEAWWGGMQEGGRAAAAAAERAELERQRAEKAAKDEANFRHLEQLLYKGKRSPLLPVKDAGVVLPGADSASSGDEGEDAAAMPAPEAAAPAADVGSGQPTQPTAATVPPTAAVPEPSSAAAPVASVGPHGGALEFKPSVHAAAGAAADAPPLPAASTGNTKYDYTDPASRPSGVAVPAVVGADGVPVPDYSSNPAAGTYPARAAQAETAVDVMD